MRYQEPPIVGPVPVVPARASVVPDLPHGAVLSDDEDRAASGRFTIGDDEPESRWRVPLPADIGGSRHAGVGGGPRLSQRKIAVAETAEIEIVGVPRGGIHRVHSPDPVGIVDVAAE